MRVKNPDSCNSALLPRRGPRKSGPPGFEIQGSTARNELPRLWRDLLLCLKKNATKGPTFGTRSNRSARAPVSVNTTGDGLRDDPDEFDKPGERAIEGDHKFELDARKGLSGFRPKGYLGFRITATGVVQ